MGLLHLSLIRRSKAYLYDCTHMYVYMYIDTVSWQKQRLSKTRLGILESKHSLLQRQMQRGVSS